MIPLYKLERLPRTQKLRKIAKFFGAAEKRLPLPAEAKSLLNKAEGPGIYSAAELDFFHDAAKLLTGDSSFTDEARRMFSEASAVFEKAALSSSDTGTIRVFDSASFRRALNNVKHILLIETGGSQADWDFDIALPGGNGLDPAKRQVFKGMCVYMEDIRSPFNVGAMFRTCESFGVEKIILSPFCADPKHKRAQRTAMGCIDIIPWERREMFSPPESSLDKPTLEYTGKVFALETGGIPINEFTFPESGLLIAGSEELGVSPQALAAADASLGRVSIPCYGAKASLNVSVAFGIALQAWAQRLK